MNRKVKRFITAICICLPFLLASCSSQGWSWAESTDVEIVLNQESDHYIAETDAPYYWGWGQPATVIAKGNGGYYLYDSDSCLLLYYEAGTETVSPLCSRPNCQHDSEECSAYFGSYYIDCIQYVNDAVYLTGSPVDDSSEVRLYRISSDGTQRQEVMTLFHADGTVNYRSVIHRGYLYYCLMDQDKTELIRRKLDGTSEAETLYLQDDRWDSAPQLLCYGNYIYLQGTWYTDDTYSELNGTIGRICIQDGSYELLKENVYRAFAVNETTLFYDSGSQIIAVDLESREETAIYDSGIPVYLSCDGEGLCLDNSCGIFLLEANEDTSAAVHTVTLLSEDGSLLSRTIVEGDYTRFLFGDGEIYFCLGAAEDGSGYYQETYYACTRQSLLDGLDEWVSLNVS